MEVIHLVVDFPQEQNSVVMGLHLIQGLSFESSHFWDFREKGTSSYLLLDGLAVLKCLLEMPEHHH